MLNASRRAILAELDALTDMGALDPDHDPRYDPERSRWVLRLVGETAERVWSDAVVRCFILGTRSVLRAGQRVGLGVDDTTGRLTVDAER